MMTDGQGTLSEEVNSEGSGWGGVGWGADASKPNIGDTCITIQLLHITLALIPLTPCAKK